MVRGVAAVEVGDLRGRRDERLVGRPLGVEHAQRVLGERDPALLAQLLPRRFEVGAQRVDVPATVVGLAQAVDDQADLLQPEPAVELPAQRDHFDVEHRVVDAEHLDADLVELAVPATLRLLVAESSGPE